MGLLRPQFSPLWPCVLCVSFSFKGPDWAGVSTLLADLACPTEGRKAAGIRGVALSHLADDATALPTHLLFFADLVGFDLIWKQALPSLPLVCHGCCLSRSSQVNRVVYNLNISSGPPHASYTFAHFLQSVSTHKGGWDWGLRSVNVTSGRALNEWRCRNEWNQMIPLKEHVWSSAHDKDKNQTL